jgi:hypothetical protein
MDAGSKSAPSGQPDQADLIAAVDRTSVQSLYRPFFAVRRGFTDQEIAFFLNVDSLTFVAFVARDR